MTSLPPKPNRRKLLLIVLGVLVVLALAGYWILRSIAIAVISSDSTTPTAEYAA